MIDRNMYLSKLIQWKDKQVVKIVTGMRRCGKSTLLLQYKEWLLNNDVLDSQIIYINFEELENEYLLEYNKLYLYIKNRLIEDKICYIFLDEIQKVKDFEKVVNSLYVKKNVDIYLTGSNAYMLSSDLATYLSGRYVKLNVLPLSFAEYLSVNESNIDNAFAQYLRFGGLPYVTNIQNIDMINDYIEGIYNTVIIKDIEERQNRKEKDNNKRNVNDISLLKTITKYLASVVGNPVSIKGITDYLISNNRKVSPNTVSSYVEALIESYIFYQVEPFDLVGKEILKANKKYYIVDLGIRNYLLPRKSYDLGFTLENIVYFELLKRGYKVYVGKLGNKEVDFVCLKDNIFTYFQVTASLSLKETFDREIRPLEMIKDNYEKIILTTDRITLGNYNGIKVINLLDWLVEC